jgi:hypothetical protein
MNAELIDYGINQENSDIRAHVSPLAQIVYVYRTEEMLDLIATGAYPVKSARQPGFDIVTATGWCVPISDVVGIRPVAWKTCPLWSGFGTNQYDKTTTVKGELACELVQRLLRMGRFPLWVVAVESCEDKDMQVDGTDILVRGTWKIQTKCDWLAAPKEHGGTGNLFIQRSEINPGKYR